METDLDILAMAAIGASLGLAFPLFIRANGTRPLAVMPLALSLLLLWGYWDSFDADQTAEQHIRRLLFPSVIIVCTLWVMWRQRDKFVRHRVETEAAETEKRAV